MPRLNLRHVRLWFNVTPMNDTDLAFASIEEVGKLFRKRKLSPVELTKLMLARIEQLNPKLNAYITVTAELALEQSKKAESELFGRRAQKGHRDRGPLHGIPISLKDNICTKDMVLLPPLPPASVTAAWERTPAALSAFPHPSRASPV
ncbi:MAG: hypothetical protein DMG53_27055 [Acidobacteria bacterium]|nr:MAG: hypothetical protein DMG53_27055 [Acidobacteriota bacterium]